MADQQYIRQRFRLGGNEASSYDWATLGRHRHLILSHFGVKAFQEHQRQQALIQAIDFAKRQMNPSLVFRSVAEYIRFHRIEVPSYAALASVITEAFKRVEEEIHALLTSHLHPLIRQKLDALLEVDPSHLLPNKPYRLTLLKRSLENARPSAIKSNVADYLLLKEHYLMLKPLLEALDLSDEMVSYYAQFVIRAQIFQVVKQENRKYLMLICFIVHQYFRLSDLLVETLLSAVKTTQNTTKREEKERIYQQHQSSAQLLEEILEGVIVHVGVLEQLEETAFSFAKTKEEKIKSLVEWVNSESIRTFKGLKPKVERLRKPQGKNETYFQVREEKSRALQTRISDIIRHVDFAISPDHPLHKAIENFKSKNGNLSGNLPDAFLRKAEGHALEKATTKTTLYKVLLASHLAEHIKGGQINVTSSFRYRPFIDYLLEEAIWRTQKQEILERALITPFRDCPLVLTQLREQLESAFNNTFGRMNAGINSLVEKRKDGKPRFITPPEPPKVELPFDLFPNERFVPVYEVLHTVNTHGRFTDCLTHWNPRHRQSRPSEEVFFAGVLGYGCNLGLTKMAHTSRNISLNTLENTVNWYFTLENVLKANHAIVDLMGKLKIGSLFKKDSKVVHTSSDGQKFYVQVDSIHANYSYKYFGKERGIVIYSFIDEMHRLFYSLTFSSSEREATYVIDGLMHHPEVQSDMHSTDSHGYTDAIFALTYLLNIAYAPRIKGFQDQNLYPMEGMQIPVLKDYEFKMGAPINTQVIQENWDILLRLVASIKLKHVSASSILRRINSYSRQHPVYLALKELGKVVRTEFLLRYMDEAGLRKRIDNQLQKIESAHHFSRAVF